jgi:hypothetical protein
VAELRCASASTSMTGIWQEKHYRLTSELASLTKIYEFEC